MFTHPAISALTGAVIGGLIALVAGILLVVSAGPDATALPASSPASISLAGIVVGGLIGLFRRSEV